VLLSDDVLFEVLHGPYRSPSGYARAAERVKQVLLGATGASWFAPGYVTLGQSRDSALVVEELLEHVDDACGEESRLRRHLAKPDKTILVSHTSGDERGRVVVLPHTPRAERLRTHEADVLRRARTLPPHLRRLFPRLLGDGEYDGQRWLAIERMPGIFIDDPVADLDQITAHAATLLVDLHLETRREVHVDETVYASLVGALVDSARRRNPWCAELLAQLDLQLRAELMGRDMPQVWMHGDYKIRGLPLIDLKYLLLYSRMLRDRSEFDVACRVIADGTAWSDSEQRMLDDYATTIGIDADLRTTLRVLFIIQTAGVRLQFDGTDPAERARLMGLLTAASALLERRAGNEVGGAA